MKIALLSHELPPETGHGGIGTYTWYHSRALARLGAEVHVLAGASESTPIRTTELDGVQVHRFHRQNRFMRTLMRCGGDSLSWTKNRLRNAVSMRSGLKQLCRDHEFDVIEVPECGAEGAFLDGVGETPMVVRLHSPARLIMPFYGVGGIDASLCGSIEGRALRRADAITSCSRFLAEESHRKLGIDSPIQVIPNGIDLELFDAADPIDVRSRFGLAKDRPIVLFAGRLERRKGIHLCADICTSILEDFEVDFLFAGGDPDGFFTLELHPGLGSEEMKGSVHHLGKLDMRTLRSCIRQCDVFLLPSLWENCPYSCLEAMAAGRPIVGADQGGIRELILDGETGLLAASGDSASFASKIQRLLNDHGLRNRLGTAARRAVEASFSDTHIARMSLDHYQSVIDGTGVRKAEAECTGGHRERL